MKSLLLSAFILISANSFASTIKDNVGALCEISKACYRFQSESSKLDEMIKEYAFEVKGEELLEEEFNTYNENLPDIDDVVWGILKEDLVPQFIKIYSSKDIKTSSLHKINKLISTLIEKGVKFGFSSNTGGNICGVSFPGLLILDTEGKTIYDISLFGWPDC